ncbi:unnamed protein product, partial [Polarella glacialis]
VDSTGSSLRGFGSLDLKQHWFLADGSVEAGDEQKLWQIPLLPGSTSGALAVSSQPELFQSSQGRWTAPSGAAWLKLNFGQVAPYRVLYASAELRSALVAAVRSGEMGAKDRIGLLLDSMALARQGSLPSSEVVSLISAFRGEVREVIKLYYSRLLGTPKTTTTIKTTTTRKTSCTLQQRGL